MESKTDISQIKIKVDKLIYLHQQLNEKYQDKQMAYSTLEKKYEELRKLIQELQQENRNLKLEVSSSRSSQNAEDMKTRIDEYINEIDKCMNLLHS